MQGATFGPGAIGGGFFPILTGPPDSANINNMEKVPYGTHVLVDSTFSNRWRIARASPGGDPLWNTCGLVRGFRLHQ